MVALKAPQFREARYTVSTTIDGKTALSLEKRQKLENMTTAEVLRAALVNYLGEDAP